MKIEQKYTEEDFKKLTLPQLHQIWFNEALTDGQIAKIYCTSKEVVKEKRKELGLTIIRGAFLSITGGKAYEDDRKIQKKIEKENKKYQKQLEKEKKFRG